MVESHPTLRLLPSGFPGNHVRVEEKSKSCEGIASLSPLSPTVYVCIKASLYMRSRRELVLIALQRRASLDERGDRPLSNGDPCVTVGDISLTFTPFCLLLTLSLPSRCVLGLPPFLLLLLLLLLKHLFSAQTVAASMQNGLWQFLSHQHLRRG